MPSPPTVQPFTPADEGPKIILLDLQGTLSANYSEMRSRLTDTSIKEKEEYRRYLVDWLRQVQKAGWKVHLFTVRHDDRRNATLESIRAKTGWQPDACWFKTTETGRAPEVKSAYLDRLIPERGPSALYALESNSETHRMFKARRIPYRRISKEDDLPPLSEFADS